MLSVYVKMSLRSLAATRWRSFLTMLGVVVGVVSVVTIISIGEGVKQQITRQVTQAGKDVITVRPGRLVERDERGRVTKVNYRNVFSSGSLAEADIATIKKTQGIGSVVPFGIFSGVPTLDSAQTNQAVLIGTTSELPSLTSRKIAYGSFFSANDKLTPAAVIGQQIAEELFKENAPIGRTFIIRGQEVVVRGVLEQSTPNPQELGLDYDHAVFLPYEYAKQIAGGQLQIYQILARPNKDTKATAAVGNLNKTLLASHGGQTDFTVLQAADSLAIASNALNLMTALVAAMAAISLLVGGIGIMNIMLVAVSERTHEIGVRKSVGATNAQIRWQFLIEAVAISAIGGILGILGSLLANYLLRVTTSLEPAFDPYLMGGALVGAILLGSFFGLAPAVKAARKDPIEALRRIN